jgi:hypothetical protein
VLLDYLAASDRDGLPGYYKGENVGVISLQAHGTNVEVAAPAQLLEILRYSLTRTAVGAP